MEMIGLVFLTIVAGFALFSGLHYFLGISTTALRVLSLLVVLAVLVVLFCKRTSEIREEIASSQSTKPNRQGRSPVTFDVQVGGTL